LETVLDSWKAWLNALIALESELKHPQFHFVHFKETMRRTSTFGTSATSPSSLPSSPSSLGVGGGTHVEMGITFSNPGSPDLFLVLPITYPSSEIQVLGIDTTNVNTKERVYNAFRALKRRNLTEVLNAWIVLSSSSPPLAQPASTTTM